MFFFIPAKNSNFLHDESIINFCRFISLNLVFLLVLTFQLNSITGAPEFQTVKPIKHRMKHFLSMILDQHGLHQDHLVVIYVQSVNVIRLGKTCRDLPLQWMLMILRPSSFLYRPAHQQYVARHEQTSFLHYVRRRHSQGQKWQRTVAKCYW